MRRGRPSTICSPQPPSSLRKNTAELDTDLATRKLIPITAVLLLQFIQFIVAGGRKEVLLCLIGQTHISDALDTLVQFIQRLGFRSKVKVTVGDKPTALDAEGRIILHWLWYSPNKESRVPLHEEHEVGSMNVVLYICLFKMLMFSHIDHRGEAVKLAHLR